MQHSFKRSIFILFTLLALTFSALGITPVYAVAPVVTVRYAKPAATGDGDCSNWASACTLQTALTGASSGEQIWVATGTHNPGANRLSTFQLVNGVNVYGGFDGIDDLFVDRNPATNITVLSGDVNGNDVGFTNNTENNIHVVTGVNNATLDGVTITAGNADGAISPYYNGGGMYNFNSSPTLTNVTFSGNSADSDGGGMYNDGSSPMLTNVTFSGNSAYSGGGMRNDVSSSPTLTNVTFSNNEADYGGGMYNVNSSPTLTNVTFSANSATYGSGGGMYNNDASSPALTNVTFSANSSANSGGGMINSDGSSPTLTNVILWGNTAISGPQIHNYLSTPIVNYSIVQGGCPSESTCSNIITADPLLGALTGSPAYFPLGVGSPAIDAGTNAGCPITSQNGLTRPFDGDAVAGAVCDIGSYEAPVVFTVTFDANGGTGSMTAQIANTATALTTNTFTKTENVFAGWNTIAGGTGTAYADGASYPFIANVTLFAQWSDPRDFVITVKTDNAGISSSTQFTIPTTGTGYYYGVDCNNDGTDEATEQTGNYTCTYGAAGTYTVRIKDNSDGGTGFPRIYFNNSGDKLKLLTIKQWGTGKWTSS